MPGATFPRAHVWADNEDVSASDLNAEFNNVLNNLLPAGIDGYELNTAQMQIQTSPGAVGTESRATSLAGEIARLRYAMNRIIGGTYWYEAPGISLNDANSQLQDLSPLNGNRIVSGKVRTTSNQPIFLQANGAAATVSLKCTATPFAYYVINAPYSLTADVSLAGLTLAPSTNNTCLVNDTNLSGQDYTRTMGEFGSVITIDTVGTNISNLIGKYAAFKLVHSGSTEYFLAYVQDATTLSRCSRGYYFDSTDAPVPRLLMSNNDVITLMRLTWVFVSTVGSLAVTYNAPTWSLKQPTSPAIGDYWYDTLNDMWKSYNGTSWTQSNSVLVGTCIQDATNTVATRSLEFYSIYENTNTVELERIDNNQVRSTRVGMKVSVAGRVFHYADNFVSFNMTSDLDPGLSEASSTVYYCYITDEGDSVLDTHAPYDRRRDLYGMYHPYNPWRCVGRVLNDVSSNFDATNIMSESLQASDALSIGKLESFAVPALPAGYLATAGGAVNRVVFAELFAKAGIIHGQGDNSTTFNLPDTRGQFLRGQANTSSNDPDRASRTAAATGGVTGDNVGSVQGSQYTSHTHQLVNNDAAATGLSGRFAVNGGDGGSSLNANAGAIGSSGGNETRPRNVYVLYGIRY